MSGSSSLDSSSPSGSVSFPPLGLSYWGRPDGVQADDVPWVGGGSPDCALWLGKADGVHAVDVP